VQNVECQIIDKEYMNKVITAIHAVSHAAKLVAVNIYMYRMKPPGIVFLCPVIEITQKV